VESSFRALARCHLAEWSAELNCQELFLELGWLAPSLESGWYSAPSPELVLCSVRSQGSQCQARVRPCPVLAPQFPESGSQARESAQQSPVWGLPFAESGSAESGLAASNSVAMFAEPAKRSVPPAKLPKAVCRKSVWQCTS
jgi:hypothetical protein